MEQNTNNESSVTVIVPSDYVIIKETEKSYYVMKPDGSKVFICKLCGKECDSPGKLAGHLNSEHRDELNYSRPGPKPKIKEEDDKEVPEEDIEYERGEIMEPDEDIEEKEIVVKKRRKPIITKRVETRQEEESSEYTPKTPEEEMIEEMCKTLKEQMMVTPGIVDAKQGKKKIEWFVDYFFRKVKALQEDKERLVAALRRHFPSADEDAIRLIADSVFEIRDNYERAITRSYYLNRSQKDSYRDSYRDYSYHNWSSYSRTRYPELYPSTTDPGGNSMMILYQVMREMMQMRDEYMKILIEQLKNNSGPSIEEIEKYAQMKAENELLKMQLNQMQEQMKELYEYLKNERKYSSAISPDGWHDDYARLTAELGSKAFNMLEQLILENKKTRQLIIKHVIPRLIPSEEGKKESFEPAGSGKTDEDIINELEGEGLVE